MTRLLVATSNAGKVREIFSALEPLGWTLLTLTELGLAPMSETGSTFAENARQKALHYARVSGELTLAEDAGLQVDLLDGRPGVQSARYAQNDSARIERVLAELQERLPGRSTPPSDALFVFLSAARFVCAVCLAGDSELYCTEGRCEGAILQQPQPGGGFGYDPIFFCRAAGAAFSRLSPAEKNAVSHRGQALAGLRAWLAQTAQFQ